MAIISMVAFDGVNGPVDVCNNSDVRCVSPSVLSKLYYNLVIVSKLKKRGRNTLFVSVPFFIHKKYTIKMGGHLWLHYRVRTPQNLYQENLQPQVPGFPRRVLLYALFAYQALPGCRLLFRY